ncbi:unnamed protein product, partial [marine sediment metagenome]
ALQKVIKSLSLSDITSIDAGGLANKTLPPPTNGSTYVL